MDVARGLDGSRLTVDEVSALPPDVQGRLRFSWRAIDNTALASVIEEDLDGKWRCVRAAACQAAAGCKAGQPHAPEQALDAAGRCYDHRPYVVGGVTAFGAPIYDEPGGVERNYCQGCSRELRTESGQLCEDCAIALALGCEGRRSRS